MGTRTAAESDVVVNGTTYSFLGHYILKSSLSYLQTLTHLAGGLAKATEVVLGGTTSAALGLAASLPVHAKLLEAAAPNAKKSYLVDSGWFVDIFEDEDRFAPINGTFRDLAPIATEAWKAILPSTSTCNPTNDEDLWLCYYGKYIWASLPVTIRERTYIVQLQYDPINLGQLGLNDLPRTGHCTEPLPTETPSTLTLTYFMMGSVIHVCIFICVPVCETDEEFLLASEIAQITLEELESSTVSGYFASACYNKVCTCVYME